MFRAISSLVLALSLFLSFAAIAAPPPSKADLKEAKQLAADAQKALRKKDYGKAAAAYEAAESKVPSFEYAFGLAKAIELKGEPVEAWRVMERAKGYGIPPKEIKSYDGFRLKLEQRLYQDNAYLELDVTPADALVREKTDGQWMPPHGRWVNRSLSTLRIEAPNYIPTTVQWHHPTGYAAKKRVELVPASAYGRIRISGGPAGGLIMVDDAALGSLPRAETRLLPPGKYTVKVEKDKYLSYSQQVDVRAGQVTDVNVVLEEAESAGQKLVKSKSFWGWMTVGIGGAAVITSGVLLALASGKQSEAEDLNATHTSGYEGYLAEYDALESDISSYAMGGWVSLGIGLALAGTGTALLIADSLDDGDESVEAAGADLHIYPLPTGVGATVRF